MGTFERILPTVPVVPGGAQGAHGGGVAAAFGGEVAAVAEHVCPAAEGPAVLMRVSANPQAGSDEPSLMAALVGPDLHVAGCDLAGRDSGWLGALGGVLGQARRNGYVGDLAVVRA